MARKRFGFVVLGLFVATTLQAQPSASPTQSMQDRSLRQGRRYVPDGPPAEIPVQWELREALPAPVARASADDPVINVGDEANQFGPVPGDLDPTIDVQLTQEIIDKATELGTATAMYEFVRNECEFQTYFGSQKGSAETLRRRAGNDYDLASLLIALLRASNIPARYAVGMVEMPADRAAAWLAVDDPEVAGSILFTNGMEGINIIDGMSNVVAVRARRIWVEAYVPVGYGAPVWVPLDPSFKQLDVIPGQDIPDAMNLDAQAFVDNYWDPTPSVPLPRPETVIEILEQDIQAYLDINQPGTTVQEVKRDSEVATELLGLLPVSLPYTVRSRDTQYSEIPTDRRYQLRFHLYDGGTTLIDHTVDLPTVAGRRLTIDYVGATPGDQATLDANGGIYQTPPNTVTLTPVLRLDGTNLVTGSSTGVGMGRTHSSDLHFLAPNNGSGLPQNVVPSIFNTMVSGAAQAHAIAIEGTAESLLTPPPVSDLEGLAPLLWNIGMDYVARVRNSDLEVGRLFHGYVTTGVTNAIVSNVVKVTTDGGGNPLTFVWGGLVVDADRAVLGYWPVDGLQPSNAEPKDFLVIGGAEGSLLESMIYEDDFGQDSVSTIKLLQLATDASITVYKRWGTLPLPTNTQPAAVQTALTNAILGGNEVTFPADPMTIGTPSTGEWTGTAWIDMDPSNGAAGYIISGGLNGGATVESWPPEWIDLSSGDLDVVCVEVFMKGGVSPTGDSPAAESIYTRDNEENIDFEYQVVVTYDDASMATLPSGSTYYKRTTQNTTITFVPGNYTFYVWIAGYTGWACPLPQAERKISIVGCIIREDDGTDAGKDAPKFIAAKPAMGMTPMKMLKALVIPEDDPSGNPLASNFDWSGGPLLKFTPASSAMPETVLEPAGEMASSAEDDQDVDVEVSLPAGKKVNGVGKFNVAGDEKHKMTVVKGEMTAYRPQHGAAYFPFTRTAVADGDEESTTLGPGIRLNNQGDQDPGGEDDLIELELTAEPADEVDFALKRGNPAIKVWSTRDKTGEIAFMGDKTEALDFMGGDMITVWVEWDSANHGNADLELQPLDEEETLDTIKFHTFRSIVTALGGENQVPMVPVDANHGTFQVAIALYGMGYDVHMYDEDNVGNNGAGAVFNEISTAAMHRSVTQVAIFGYSHGGGSTFHLSQRVNGAGLGVTIPYTSYCDAVENDSNADIQRELRLPPGSAFHLNHYQVGAFFEDGGLDGGPVAGSNPAPNGLNVETTAWGANATHFDVDDFAQVRNPIQTNLTGRVTR